MPREPQIHSSVWAQDDIEFNVYCDDPVMLPDQDRYPLQPNGDCNFRYRASVIPKNAILNNWVFVSTNQKTTFSKDLGAQIELTIKACRGAIVCSNPDCPTLQRPYHKAVESLPNCPACIGLNFPLIPLLCPAKIRFYKCFRYDDKSKFDLIVAHRGIHTHACPTINKPDFYALEKLSEFIQTNPEKTVIKWKTGREKDSDIAIHNPVKNLSVAFKHANRFSYYRKKTLTELGIVFSLNDDDGSLLGLQSKFKKKIIVSSSVLNTEMHISVQTDEMKARLLDKSHQGRSIGGIITDATFKIFNRGYLLSSCVYCCLIYRWVPVLYTWILNLTSEAHVPHFKVLISQIMEAYDDIDIANLLLAQVVDYSAAQRQGFILAYMSVRLSRNPFDDQHISEATAKSLLKGCAQHFRASVTRIAINHSIVNQEEENRFRFLTKSLVTTPDLELFERDKELLITEFPNCIKWITWWSQADVARMIFEVCPSFCPLTQERPNDE